MILVRLNNTFYRSQFRLECTLYLTFRLLIRYDHCPHIFSNIGEFSAGIEERTLRNDLANKESSQINFSFTFLTKLKFGKNLIELECL